MFTVVSVSLSIQGWGGHIEPHQSCSLGDALPAGKQAVDLRPKGLPFVVEQPYGDRAPQASFAASANSPRIW